MLRMSSERLSDSHYSTQLEGSDSNTEAPMAFSLWAGQGLPWGPPATQSCLLGYPFPLVPSWDFSRRDWRDSTTWRWSFSEKTPSGGSAWLPVCPPSAHPAWNGRASCLPFLLFLPLELSPHTPGFWALHLSPAMTAGLREFLVYLKLIN